ncbi:ribosomal protein S6 [Orientia chuto str. Dubai]|uniref:Small ribosomal subunit protein bS6 n=1 Tax=Orientia chuto str. Dubai TaxID=1359168 RepID=A0A0F3MI00_9RICK|nr:30S ribosomal protein S6 [Candidatus Orientia mediorientalis]KJV55390.1 ribosomal protein S6 [Orientia chuto str. Dubai]
MRSYELVLIVRPELSSTEVDKLTEELISIVNKYEGKIVKHEYWGMRSLAYKINRNQRAHYIMLAVCINNNILEKLKNKINNNLEVIRYRFIKVKEVSQNASPILKNQNFEQPTVDVTG